MRYFDIYHMVRFVCMLEDFNCMLFDDWILILGIEPLVLCTEYLRNVLCNQ